MWEKTSKKIRKENIRWTSAFFMFPTSPNRAATASLYRTNWTACKYAVWLEFTQLIATSAYLYIHTHLFDYFISDYTYVYISNYKLQNTFSFVCCCFFWQERGNIEIEISDKQKKNFFFLWKLMLFLDFELDRSIQYVSFVFIERFRQKNVRGVWNYVYAAGAS